MKKMAYIVTALIEMISIITIVCIIAVGIDVANHIAYWFNNRKRNK